MRNKKQTLRRISTLYVMLFIVIIISLVLSFSSEAFSEGFATGMNDAERLYRVKGDKSVTAQIVYDMPGITKNLDFDIPVYSNPDVSNTTVNARPSSFDVEVVSQSGIGGLSISLIVALFALLAYGAIFVIIFMILNSLRRSIMTDDMFDKRNIILTRLIGVLLICGSLLGSLAVWIERRAIAPYFADSNFSVNTSFPFNFSDIIMGVLIFFVAEIFVIGYSISEERKLTI